MPTKTTKPSLTLGAIEREFATEDACKAMLQKLRWPEKVACPRCQSAAKIATSKARPFTWKCKACNPNGYRFSVLTGSVFENTNVPLRTWFRVAFLMISSKKGISALQVHRMIDPVRGAKGSYKTAWYMCMRLRAAMKDEGFFRMMGVVEVDETYVGGEARNAHRGNRGKVTSAKPGKLGNLIPPKSAVVGAIERKGNVVAQVINRADAATLQGFIKQTVSDDVSLIATDDNFAYRNLKRAGYPHQAVNHTQKEFVRGSVHTANIDNFWSLLKRGIMGTYHKVSATHLPLYVNEFSWRYNHRNDADIFRAVLAGC